MDNHCHLAAVHWGEHPPQRLKLSHSNCCPTWRQNSIRNVVWKTSICICSCYHAVHIRGYLHFDRVDFQFEFFLHSHMHTNWTHESRIFPFFFLRWFGKTGEDEIRLCTHHLALVRRHSDSCHDKISPQMYTCICGFPPILCCYVAEEADYKEMATFIVQGDQI